MMDEADTLKGHLAAMEMAFSDLVQKYERCKTIVQGYKQNEDTLREHVQMLEETLQKNEEKYEALKAHAKSQLERLGFCCCCLKKQLNFCFVVVFKGLAMR